MVVFEADYDEIELQNIVMTSFQWRHHYDLTKITSQIFFPIWAPPYQNFWWRQWSWVNNMMIIKKSGLGLGLTGLSLEKIGGLSLVT